MLTDIVMTLNGERIILDNPFTGLDSETLNTIFDLISSWDFLDIEWEENICEDVLSSSRNWEDIVSLAEQLLCHNGIYRDKVSGRLFR